jgi:hypothetical protein
MSMADGEAKPDPNTTPAAPMVAAQQGPSTPGTGKKGELQRASGRWWKLALTCLVLVMLLLGSAVWLALLATPKPSNDTTNVLGLQLTVNRIWLLAAVAGLLGGSIRGLFILSLDTYAFEYRFHAKKHSRWARRVLGNAFEDDFDPLHNWWPYALEPVLGMGLGFLFGLLQLVGLIPFLGSIGPDNRPGETSDGSSRLDAAVAVVAILAGILTEDAVSWVKRIFRGKTESDVEALPKSVVAGVPDRSREKADSPPAEGGR